MMKPRKSIVMSDNTIAVLASSVLEDSPPEQKEFAASLLRAYLTILWADDAPNASTQQRHLKLLLDMASEFHKLCTKGGTLLPQKVMEELFPYIRRGAGVTRGGRKGAKAANETQRSRYPEYCAHLDELLQRRPTLSKRAAYKIVSKKYRRVGEWTIKRADLARRKK